MALQCSTEWFNWCMDQLLRTANGYVPCSKAFQMPFTIFRPLAHKNNNSRVQSSCWPKSSNKLVSSINSQWPFVIMNFFASAHLPSDLMKKVCLSHLQSYQTLKNNKEYLLRRPQSRKLRCFQRRDSTWYPAHCPDGHTLLGNGSPDDQAETEWQNYIVLHLLYSVYV